MRLSGSVVFAFRSFGGFDLPGLRPRIFSPVAASRDSRYSRRLARASRSALRSASRRDRQDFRRRRRSSDVRIPSGSLSPRSEPYSRSSHSSASLASSTIFAIADARESRVRLEAREAFAESFVPSRATIPGLSTSQRSHRRRTSANKELKHSRFASRKRAIVL
jgi:hypothetical protein